MDALGARDLGAAPGKALAALEYKRHAEAALSPIMRSFRIITSFRYSTIKDSCAAPKVRRFTSRLMPDVRDSK